MFPPGTTIEDIQATAARLREMFGADTHRTICSAGFRPQSTAPFRVRVIRAPVWPGFFFGGRSPVVPQIPSVPNTLYCIKVTPKACWVRK